eukprot:CAMPEP_0115209074 /NCGR_PEP_ID=MMETSP0270-20121206/21550_1 /TAXON_ID=71861 /ORGANISM="Scrippsiella trochoidea, Strain CCMP3099" /LENGTH=542 /DNA_ID=CAMNT_0002622699 /DNA_START=191 /DNA_END=1819 /DNA_ORIENTATION=+
MAHWGRTAGIIAIRHNNQGITEVLLVNKGGKMLDFPKGKRSRMKEELAWEVAWREWYSETGLSPEHLNFLMPQHVFIDAASGCHYFLAMWEGGQGCPQQWMPFPARAGDNKPVTTAQWTPIREAQSSEHLGKLQRMILTRAEEENQKLMAFVPSMGMPGVSMPGMGMQGMLWSPPVDNYNKMPLEASPEAEEPFDIDQTTAAGSLQPSLLETGRSDEKFDCQSPEEETLTGWEVGALLMRHPTVLLGNKPECDTVEKLLQQGNEAEKSAIMRWMCKDLLSAAEDQCACRVVQELLKAPSKSDGSMMLAKIFPYTDRLLESQHGNHVLTKAVEVAIPAEIATVIDKVWRTGAVYVAKHRFGCRLCERLIEHHGEDHAVVALLNSLALSSVEMCKHRYGNYVLQSMVEHGPAGPTKKVFEALVPKMGEMAVHRFASHLAQKMLQVDCPPADKLKAAEALIRDSSHPLAEIAANRFGNFVINDMLSFLTTEEDIDKDKRVALVEEIREKLNVENEELTKTEHFKSVKATLDDCWNTLQNDEDQEG